MTTFSTALGQQQAQRGRGNRLGSFRSELLVQRAERIPEPQPETPDFEAREVPERATGGFGDFVGGALAHRAHSSYQVLALVHRRDVGTRRLGPRLADAAATDVLPVGISEEERAKKRKAAALLRSWLDDETLKTSDEKAWAEFKAGIDEDRQSQRKLFP